MNMKRKLTALLLLLALLLSLTACGDAVQTIDTVQQAAQTVQELADALDDAQTQSPEMIAEEAQSDETEDEAPVEETMTEEAAAPEEHAEPNAQEAQTQEAPDIEEDGTYTTKEDVARYIHTYGHLPDNFITKKQAQALGWEGGTLEPYAPGKCIGGSRFGNYEGILPEKDGRTYTECDIDTLGAEKRGGKRIVFSNDGLIYYTEDHYETFEPLYGEES